MTERPTTGNGGPTRSPPPNASVQGTASRPPGAAPEATTFVPFTPGTTTYRVELQNDSSGGQQRSYQGTERRIVRSIGPHAQSWTIDGLYTAVDEESGRRYPDTFYVTWDAHGAYYTGYDGQVPCTLSKPLLIFPAPVEDGRRWEDAAKCNDDPISIAGSIRRDGDTWIVEHRWTYSSPVDAPETLTFDHLGNPPKEIFLDRPTGLGSDEVRTLM